MSGARCGLESLIVEWLESLHPTMPMEIPFWSAVRMPMDMTLWSAAPRMRMGLESLERCA